MTFVVCCCVIHILTEIGLCSETQLQVLYVVQDLEPVQVLDQLRGASFLPSFLVTATVSKRHALLKAIDDHWTVDLRQLRWMRWMRY